jgi:methylated-DNA-protein-cysteine methyltransferase-like protein
MRLGLGEKLERKKITFSQQVISLISKIPKGKVSSYGQIAKLTGKPHASRGVAWILNSCSKSHGLPWHRVVNSKGQISFPRGTPSYQRQRRLLLREKIEFNAKDEIDFKKHLWKKKPRVKPNLRTPRRTPKMFAD